MKGAVRFTLLSYDDQELQGVKVEDRSFLSLNSSLATLTPSM
jgi:hypothetical protein